MKIDEYINKFDKFETKVVTIACKICKKEVKRNFAAVCAHLTKEHEGIKIEKYEEKFKLKPYDLHFPVPPNLAKKRPIEEQEMKAVENKKARIVEPKTPSKPKKSVGVQIVKEVKNPETAQEKKWFHGCEFKCQICYQVYYKIMTSTWQKEGLHCMKVLQMML